MDYIFYNGTIISLNGDNKTNQAVLVRDKYIAGIGSFKDMKYLSNNPKIINLQNKTIMPAMTDSHTHFVETAKLSMMIDMSGIRSERAFYEKLIKYRESIDLSKTKWIYGFGWEKIHIEKCTTINATLIDKVFPNIPVSLASKDLHSNLCNSIALKILKQCPESTGIILEKGFLGENWWSLLSRVAPQLDEEQLNKAITLLIKKCQRMGLCGVHSMENHLNAELVSKLAQNEYFYFTWYYSELELQRDSIACIEGTDIFARENDHFVNGGIKMFTDGSLGSDTAWMFEFNTQVDKKLLYNLKKKIYNANKLKLQVAVHTLGDMAVYLIADILKDVYNTLDNKIVNRMEHLQAVRPKDIALLKEAHVHASMQPVHKKNDDAILAEKWKIARNYAFPIDKVNQACILAFGSDSPVETLNPFEGIEYASSLLSFTDILKAYTYHHHLIANKEISYGQIKKGQIANLIVVSLEKGVRETELTMIDGEIVNCT